MTAAKAGTQANSSCPRCGTMFRCGMVAADDQCWCVKLPHIMPVLSSASATTGTAGASCFCPACLQQVTNERQHNDSPARN